MKVSLRVVLARLGNLLSFICVACVDEDIIQPFRVWSCGIPLSVPSGVGWCEDASWPSLSSAAGRFANAWLFYFHFSPLAPFLIVDKQISPVFARAVLTLTSGSQQRAATERVIDGRTENYRKDCCKKVPTQKVYAVAKKERTVAIWSNETERCIFDCGFPVN